MLLECVEDHVRVHLEFLHHVGERVPFDLRQGEEEVLVGHDRVFAATALLHGSVDHALSGLVNLVGGDVELVHDPVLCNSSPSKDQHSAPNSAIRTSDG